MKKESRKRISTKRRKFREGRDDRDYNNLKIIMASFYWHWGFYSPYRTRRKKNFPKLPLVVDGEEVPPSLLFSLHLPSSSSLLFPPSLSPSSSHCQSPAGSCCHPISLLADNWEGEGEGEEEEEGGKEREGEEGREGERLPAIVPSHGRLAGGGRRGCL